MNCTNWKSKQSLQFWSLIEPSLLDYQVWIHPSNHFGTLRGDFRKADLSPIVFDTLTIHQTRLRSKRVLAFSCLINYCRQLCGHEMTSCQNLTLNSRQEVNKTMVFSSNKQQIVDTDFRTRSESVTASTSKKKKTHPKTYSIYYPMLLSPLCYCEAILQVLCLRHSTMSKTFTFMVL